MGGGIYTTNSENQLQGSLISENKSKHGGGINAKDVTYLNINLSTFSENFAVENGGAIIIDNSGLLFSTNSIQTITNTKLLHNSARNGGALYFKDNKNIQLDNNLIAFNNNNYQGEYFGGGLFIKDCENMSIDHNTIYGNGSGSDNLSENNSYAGSIYFSGGELNIVNSIFWNNIADYYQEWYLSGSSGGAIDATYTIISSYYNTNCEEECINDVPVFMDIDSSDFKLSTNSPGKAGSSDGTDMGYSNEL